jgi:hypothetical protein
MTDEVPTEPYTPSLKIYKVNGGKLPRPKTLELDGSKRLALCSGHITSGKGFQVPLDRPLG